MPNTYPPDLQTAWAHVVAHAWKDPDFFTELTENPKDALDKALESEKLRDNPDFLGHCLTIQSYGGAVFPLAKLPEKLKKLSEEQLVAFAHQEGLFGILELQTVWAQLVAHAWTDSDFFELLTNDLKGALGSEMLQKKKPDLFEYFHTTVSNGGPVFPLPPLPEGLKDLEEEQLAALVDQEGFFGILRFT
jgi:hypothetical protein